MDLFDLSAKLSLNSDDFDSGLRRAGQKVSSFLGTAVKVGAAAVTAATTAMIAFGKSAVSVGEQFDRYMSQVAATMGVSVDEIGELRDFALEMGSTTVFSATQAAQALNYMALAGYDAEKSMAMMPTVLNLAAAGGMDLARASDMVTDASSALGLSIEETASMVNQMAKTAASSNTNVEQLGDAMLTIGGTAKFMAGGTDRLQTVLGLLADNGIKGTEAGTHLRNMLLKLSSPTKDGEKILKALGVSIFDSSGKMRDMQYIMQDLNAAMSGLTEQEKVKALSELFNARDLSAVNALLGTSTERWDQLGSAIANAGNSAQEMSETQLNNLSGAITMFKSALEGAQITLSDQLTPKITEFVKFGTEGIQRLTTAFREDGLSGAMSELGDLLSEGVAMITADLPELVEAGSALLGALVDGIVNNAPALADAFVTIINNLVDSLTTDPEKMAQVVDVGAEVIIKLINGFTLVFPKLVKAAVRIITTLARSISKNIGPILKAVTEALSEVIAVLTSPDVLPELIAAGVEMILAIVNGLIGALPDLIAAIPVLINGLLSAFSGENLQMIVDGAVSLVQALCDGLIQNLPQLITAAIDIIMALVDALTDPDNMVMLVMAAVEITIALQKALIEAIPILIEKLPEIIVAIVTALVEAAPKMLEAGVELIAQLYEGIKSCFDDITGWAAEIIGKIKDGTLWEDIKQWGIDWINKIYEGLISCFEWLKQWGKDIWNKIQEADIWEDVKAWGAKIIPYIREGIEAAWDKLVEIGENIVSGIWQGIKDSATWLTEKLKEWVNGAIDSVKGFLGIASPSKVFAEIGKFTAEGFGEGFGDQFTKVSKDIENQMSALTDQSIQLMSNLSAGAENSFSGMNGTGPVGSSNVLSSITELLTEIRDKDLTVVLDDGTLIGKIDKALGQTALRKARGNA